MFFPVFVIFYFILRKQTNLVWKMSHSIEPRPSDWDRVTTLFPSPRVTEFVKWLDLIKSVDHLLVVKKNNNCYYYFKDVILIRDTRNKTNPEMVNCVHEFENHVCKYTILINKFLSGSQIHKQQFTILELILFCVCLKILHPKAILVDLEISSNLKWTLYSHKHALQILQFALCMSNLLNLLLSFIIRKLCLNVVYEIFQKLWL